MPPCTLGKFPASDANPVHFPLAELSVPCVPSGTGNEDNRPKASSHKTTQAPDLLPGGPVCPVSTPGGEAIRPNQVRAGLGHTGPSLAERKEKGPARKAAASADGEYASFRLPTRRSVSPKTSSGKRCEKQAGERPGVAHRRPVPGHFARQSRSFRDFSKASISLFSGVGFGALESRPGSEKQNFPAASLFCGCHRRGQRKDEE